MNEHQKYLIRKTVHSFFSANRIPTSDAVYREVQNNEEIPNISYSKLYNVLHELKFKYIHRFQLTVNIEIYVYFK
jgi:Fe2+ or Zn2+ uptake regulation protein